MGSSPRANNSSKLNLRKSQRAPFERRVARLSALLVAPGLVVSGILVWLQPWSLESKLLLIGAELLARLLIGTALLEHVIRPLHTLANVVGAVAEPDYSFRVRFA